MKQQLIIISAGAFAREIHSLARGIRKHQGEDCPWDIKGFLDDRPDILKGKELEKVPILSSVETYQLKPDDVFICAIGNLKDRRRYISLIKKKGGKFGKLISPHAIVTSKKKRIKSGVTIGPFSVISSDVTIGQHTVICDHVTLGHDVSVGRNCQIGAFAFVGGGAIIGRRVTVHPHASILPGAVIGNDATVGAGSVVLGRVGEGETVFGVPAQRVKT